MGRRSITGGVSAKGNRIQFDFLYKGTRYRPTVEIEPSQANLQRARRRHAEILRKIYAGTFCFAEEFPDYRFIEKLAPAERQTFNALADTYLETIGDKEHATRESYRKILAHHWRPKIGEKDVREIRYSDLARYVGGHPWGSDKTRNNVVSVMRSVFALAKADNIITLNPAAELKCLRVQKEPPDPFDVAEVEKIIAGIRKDWGEHDACYFEFGIFTGCRPSEVIALDWPNVDMSKGIAKIKTARVMAKNKRKTKTSVSREIELCPRALAAVRRMRGLTQKDEGAVFRREDGEPWHDLQVQWKHWAYTMKRLGIRYREPYQVRHTSVTWNLMIGKNVLWVAEQHGHSAQVMLKTYAKWLKGANEKTIEQIKAAMGFGSSLAVATEKTA